MKRIKVGAGLLAVAGLVTFGLVSGPASANLAGSSFEGNDGNQVVNTVGNLDWQNMPGVVVGPDLPSGQTDNSFGNGSKEQSPNVTVGLGSIPNSKADLGRFAVASQFAGGQNFLYLAWTRNNTGGTTNFDFEINKLAQPNLLTAGAKTLNRSAGDMLVTFDFDGGSQTSSIGLLRWVTTGSAAQCFDGANSLPCWGNRQDLTGLGEAEAAVNTSGSIVNFLGGPASIPAFEFGETAINLTAAGVFPPGTCTAFGSVFVKSRSATSFPAELKDFIAPQPVSISNCGTIVIDKVTVPSPDPTATSFPFTLTGGTLNDSFSLTDAATPFVHQNVPVGSGYVAAETTVPANWALTSATCDDGSLVTNIDVGPNETVTCTFTNTLQTGAITVTKDRKHAADGPGSHPHAGVDFTVNGVTKPTDATGVACFDGLLFGTYSVHETTPAGYAANADQNSTVDNTATCAGGGGETVAFHNTPLTDLSVSVDSQVDGGTASTISCSRTDVDPDVVVATGTTDNVGDGSASAANLVPGTYVCTVVIDP